MNMRISFLPAGLALLLAVALAPARAADQQAQPTPADIPSAVQSADQPGDSGVTIKPGESQTQVTEQRQNGQVTQIKVKKGKNNTYVIRPGQGGRDAASLGTHTNPAQWVVKEFGPGKEPKKDKAAPPPPAPDANASDKK